MPLADMVAVTSQILNCPFPIRHPRSDAGNPTFTVRPHSRFNAPAQPSVRSFVRPPPPACSLRLDAATPAGTSPMRRRPSTRRTSTDACHIPILPRAWWWRKQPHERAFRIFSRESSREFGKRPISVLTIGEDSISSTSDGIPEWVDAAYRGERTNERTDERTVGQGCEIGNQNAAWVFPAQTHVRWSKHLANGSDVVGGAGRETPARRLGRRHETGPRTPRPQGLTG